MLCKLRALGEAHPALYTTISLLTGMRPLMDSEVNLGCKSFVALIAREWFLAGMSAHVTAEAVRVHVTFVTESAVVRLAWRVHVGHVLFNIAHQTSTLSALGRLFVDEHVLV